MLRARRAIVPATQRSRVRAAKHLEQTDPRNRLPREAASEHANQTPDAEEVEVGYSDGCALDIAFLGRV